MPILAHHKGAGEITNVHCTVSVPMIWLWVAPEIACNNEGGVVGVSNLARDVGIGECEMPDRLRLRPANRNGL